MAAPATSTRENALANLRTTLAAVTAGAIYNLTIDDVARVDGPLYAYIDFTGGFKTFAFIEEGLSSWTLQRQDGTWLVTLEVFVQVATVYEPDTKNPFQQKSATKSTLRSKMVADVLKAVMADHTRGGYAKQGTRITDDAPINLDELWDDGWRGDRWTASEIRLELAMEVSEDAP